MLRRLFAFGLLSCLLLAQQESAVPDGPIGIETGALTGLTHSEGEIRVHTVHVASIADAPVFYPNSINANPDDKISFIFHSGNHSVIQSLYEWPCVPRAAVDGVNGFHSGFFPVKGSSTATPPVWNMTILNASPILFYCGAPGSCVNNGMLGIINPNKDTNLSKQIALAKESKFMLEYDEVMEPAASASMTALAAQVMADAKDDSGMSPGAIAGIAVGAAGGLALVGALLCFLRRNKKLKRQLHETIRPSALQHQTETHHGHTSFYQPEDPRMFRKTSPLPPYAQEAPMMELIKSPDTESHVRTMSTPSPYIAYSPGVSARNTIRYESARTEDEDAQLLIDHSRFSDTSELGGSVPDQRHELNAQPLSPSRSASGLGIGR